MRNRWLGAALALIAAGVSAWAYGRLPAEVALPWVADDPVSPLRAALLLPAAIAGLWLLLQLFPLIDPWGGEPYARFGDTYWLMANAMLLFMLAAHALMLAGATGVAGGTDRWIIAVAGVLAAVLGNYLSRIEPNWFFGLRTPWTLSDREVWRKTHRLIGRVLFAVGLLLVAAAPIIALRPAPVLGGLAAALAVGSFGTSYTYWRQRRRSPRPGEGHS